ncbi:MAG: adenylyl-sulfate kinase, partial [Acidobacteriota bacterium]|nr:adenylyl-sulfate kinase [Acidobacteriota bacterium]
RGDNVVRRTEHMPWYGGGPLLDYLETVHIASDRNLIDLRFPVQQVLRPDQSFRGYCGSVASGVLRKGDEIEVLPSKRRSRIASIVTYDGELEEAFPPLAVTVTLEDELDVSRGDMIAHPANVPRSDRVFESMVVWMAEEPLSAGKPYLIKHQTGLVPAVVAEVRYKINVGTLHREPAESLELNEIGRVVVSTSRPLHYDSYKRNRATGAFVLIDRLSNVTVGAGMIRDVVAEDDDEERGAAGVAVDLVEQRSEITPEQRADRLGQRPFTLWLTGLPRSGKSSIAFRLEKLLFDRGQVVFALDGTNLRLGMSQDLTFSGLDRSENNRRAAETAKLACDLGLITIAAFVSPFEADRVMARHLIGDQRFLEVFCDAPVEVCEARDTNGLYEKARSGQLANFTGVNAPYERPTNPDIVVDTAAGSIDESCAAIIARLVELGFLGE